MTEKQMFTLKDLKVMPILCIWIVLLIASIDTYHAEDFFHKMKTLKNGKVDWVA